MALHSPRLSHDSGCFVPPWSPAASPLAESLREYFAAHRPYFNDIIKLNEPVPVTAMTLSEWQRPATLTSLLAAYGDHIYRNQPQLSREHKPLKSLWAQWYIGLLVPPVIMALLTQPKALNIAPQHMRVEFHATGRAQCFWIEVAEDCQASKLPLHLRLEQFIVDGLMPIVAALEASGEINARLIWSNTGYLVNWFLGELKPLLDEQSLAALVQACFFEKQLSCGRENPLYRTVISREGILVRRTCCQRYKLPDVQPCGDCTLK
ncbi:siderophore-iron reductase FhuF [Cedecea neteri]|uniref:siderophore-iron reductase FhuF n=1 Tax=Cedecea neteri TaxID=158822 RepID=UPI002AA796F3|nr:siderophore-iron reductase FhuF [Cedecea neteri]WPU22444.1 siderophore-iron reductase FhuF [Cedecea neteri]